MSAEVLIHRVQTFVYSNTYLLLSDHFNLVELSTLEAMAPRGKEKRKLNHDALEKNGIIIDERVESNIEETSAYLERYACKQASIVAEGLLDFAGILSETAYARCPPEPCIHNRPIIY